MCVCLVWQEGGDEFAPNITLRAGYSIMIETCSPGGSALAIWNTPDDHSYHRSVGLRDQAPSTPASWSTILKGFGLPLGVS